MQELQIFNNQEFGEVRVLEVNNEPYFVGKDVAEILGYERPTKAVNDHVDVEDKDVIPIQDSIGRMQNTPIINESGLYSLILSSKLPTAKKFKRWVTSEVLPSIRKHGAYMTPQKIEEALLNPDTLIQLATTIKEEQAKNRALELTNKQQKQQLLELKPKADYTDLILNNKSLVTITQIAKDYGMSGNKMNDLLHSLGVQYKQSGQWLLYSKHQRSGYTHSETVPIKHKDGKETVKMNTKWTQKGRLFIYDLLKRNGYLPLIEQ